MAAPAAVLQFTWTGRDAKGNTCKTKMIIGDATVTAINTDKNAITTALNAVSNAHWEANVDVGTRTVYGAAANYLDAEDKMELVFADPAGDYHRFQIGAPKTTNFLADQETVNQADTNVAALLTAMETFVYGRGTDTATLAYIGGIRQRRKLHRRMSIFTKSGNLDEPAQ